MKINADYQLIDINGPMVEAATNGKGEKVLQPVTIAAMVPHCYGASDAQMSEDEMQNRYNIMTKFCKGGIVETNHEELALLKKCMRLKFNHPGICIPFNTAVEGPALVADEAAAA